MVLQRFHKCDGCFRPVKRKLASLQTRAEYECYGERYIKCFWGLCDQQKSTEAFTVKSDGQVVTNQPRRQAKPYNPSANI